MSSPLVNIMFKGSFEAAREAAKQRKQWLLVNIQAENDLDSIRLNRELWIDDLVQDIIKSNCIFWQQPSVSKDAKRYCARYKSTSFPCIALIHPGTGDTRWSTRGFIDRETFTETAISWVAPTFPPTRSSGGAGGTQSGLGCDEEKAVEQFMDTTSVTSKADARQWLEGAASRAEARDIGDAEARDIGDAQAKSKRDRKVAMLRDSSFADRPKRRRYIEGAGSNLLSGIATPRRPLPGAVVQGKRENSFLGGLRQARGTSVRNSSVGRLFPGENGIFSDPKDNEGNIRRAGTSSSRHNMMFSGDFKAARQAAEKQEKWLLVNVQAGTGSAGSYDSDRLNSELWTHATVQSMIAKKCIFWQHSAVLERAKQYLDKYKVVGYPHVALIDPLTGIVKLEFTGFLEPRLILEKVLLTTSFLAMTPNTPSEIFEAMALFDKAARGIPSPRPRQENGDGGEEEVTVVSKPAADSKGKGKRKGEGKGKGKGAGEEEDEVTLVSKPSKDSLVTPPRPHLHHRDGAATAEDDVELLGSMGGSHLPHHRFNCPEHEFVPGDESKCTEFCKKCFCYVCDRAVSECVEWPNHCQATNSGPEAAKWKSRREDACGMRHPSARQDRQSRRQRQQQLLEDMGFAREMVETALKEADWNVIVAVEYMVGIV